MAYNHDIPIIQTNLEVRNELTFKTGISARHITKETLNVLILNFIV
jgi:hypothetical protein